MKGSWFQIPENVILCVLAETVKKKDLLFMMFAMEAARKKLFFDNY